MNLLPTLNYFPGDKYAPIPPAEKGVQTITAEHFVDVSPGSLEGLQFDRTGENLYYVLTFERKVMKVNMKTKEVSLVVEIPYPEALPAAVKIHKDGRLFIACASEDFVKPAGVVFCCNPDGTNIQTVVDQGKYIVDDMVFDSKGGFYFTDFQGHAYNPIGSIYYVHPDMKTITPVLQNIEGPNGIALSPDESILFVSIPFTGRILRLTLRDDDKTKIAVFGCVITYTTTGNYGPDSLCNDIDNNIYTAMSAQGRVLVFNSNGFLIGQVLMPGRDEGRNLTTLHATIRPGTRELYIGAADSLGEIGAEPAPSSIFRCQAFAEANMSQYQYR